MCASVCACANKHTPDSGGRAHKRASLSLTLWPVKRVQSSPSLYTAAGISDGAGLSKTQLFNIDFL